MRKLQIENSHLIKTKIRDNPIKYIAKQLNNAIAKFDDDYGIAATKWEKDTVFSEFEQHISEKIYSKSTLDLVWFSEELMTDFDYFDFVRRSIQE